MKIYTEVRNAKNQRWVNSVYHVGIDFIFFGYLHRFNDNFCAFKHFSVNYGIMLHSAVDNFRNISWNTSKFYLCLYFVDNCYGHYLSGTSPTILRLDYSYGCCTGLTPLETTFPGHYRKIHCCSLCMRITRSLIPICGDRTISPLMQCVIYTHVYS